MIVVNPMRDELVPGSSRFKDWIEKEAQRKTRPGKAGRPGTN